jgi:ABC-2 type transport system permease protein
MRAANILHLGVKELWGLARDPILLVMIFFAFSVQVYTGATAAPETLNKAPIAIVDEDQSPLSARIIGAFYRPYFLPPILITRAEMDARMDAGLDTFALNIPPTSSAMCWPGGPRRFSSTSMRPASARPSPAAATS